MNKARAMACFLGVVLLAATVAGCHSQEPEVDQPQYTTVPVERSDVIRTVYAPGGLIPTDTLTLSSPVDSELLELLVKPGEKVNKGDMLAKLDASERNEQLRTKENNLLQAKINLKNAEIALDKAINPYSDEEIEEAEDELYLAEDQLRYVLKHGPESEVLSWQEEVYQRQKRLDEMKEGGDKDDIEVKKMQVKLAEAQLENAMDEVEEARDASPEIIAPCDSTVLDVKYREGDIVTDGSPIIVLADLNHMGLMTTVGQDKITSIRPGMSADIILDALPGITLKGRVSYVVPQKSPTSQTVTYEVYLNLGEAAEGLLPDMTGGATILVAEKHDVLRVPRRLVKIAPDGSGRVEILEQDQPVVREVVIGVRGDSYYEIISGLSEGDLVIQRGKF